MPSKPLKNPVALPDEQQGNAPDPRDYFRDFQRAQNAADRRRAYAKVAGGGFRGLTQTQLGSSDMLARGIETISGHVKDAGRATPYVGVLAIGAGAAGEHLAGMARRLDEMADRYGEYSPEVARARAQAEVKQTMFELEQARKYGPQIAEWVTAQTDLSRSFEGAQAAGAVKAAPGLIPRMQDFAKALNELDEAVTDWDAGKFMKAIGSAFGVDLSPEAGINWLKSQFGLGGNKEAVKEGVKEGVKEAIKEAAKAKGMDVDDFLFRGFHPAGGVKPVVDKADDWMATHPQFELADIDMPINAVILKAVGNPAAAPNERDFSP